MLDLGVVEYLVGPVLGLVLAGFADVAWCGSRITAAVYILGETHGGRVSGGVAG